MPKDPIAGFTNQRSGKERQLLAAKHQRDATLISASAPEDPRIGEAQKRLGLMLADYRERNPGINRTTGREMQKMVDDFRNTCRRKGIELPKMRVVYFVAMNHICVWPQDLEHAELQKRVHMFIVHRQRHNRPVDANDLAMGIRRAYPDYSPSRSNLILPASFKPN